MAKLMKTGMRAQTVGAYYLKDLRKYSRLTVDAARRQSCREALHYLEDTNGAMGGYEAAVRVVGRRPAAVAGQALARAGSAFFDSCRVGPRGEKPPQRARRGAR